ncbi:hypothetical protein BV378_30265 [Nostoc sp. RF31YmG]|nr:hypothetical protein BV378_30265 [Nostoc sp. RF31YmG]
MIKIKQINSNEMNYLPLRSNVGIDYTILRDLLAAGSWKEADEETGRVMLNAVEQEGRHYFSQEVIKKFPCEDLRTINQLWLHYSNNKFGFSVQKNIWINCGGTSELVEYDVFQMKVFQKFMDTIGWRKWRFSLNLRMIDSNLKGQWNSGSRSDLLRFGSKLEITFNTHECLSYSDLKFSLAAPSGHLPRMGEQTFIGSWYREWLLSLNPNCL